MRHFKPFAPVLRAGMALMCCVAAFAGEVRYRHAQQGGVSDAVIVDGCPLVFTTQVFGFDTLGGSHPTSAAVQVERALDNLALAVEAIGASTDSLVRIHAHVTDSEVTPLLEDALARRFPGEVRPALTLAQSKLPVANAVIAVDAIAVDRAARRDPRPVYAWTNSLAGSPRESHAARAPIGPLLFISGRAEPGDVETAARETLNRLAADLSVAGLTWADVVQLKAFVDPMDSANVVRDAVHRVFTGQPVPPLVLVEWRSSQRPVEIELVASARAGKPANVQVDYVTPPGERPNPLFTRMVRVEGGPLLFTSGLFGGSERDAERETREIFLRLQDVLNASGGNVSHLVKATYQVTNDASNTAVNTVRRELYQPPRTPAASKVTVAGTGREGKTVTLDMIATLPSP